MKEERNLDSLKVEFWEYYKGKLLPKYTQLEKIRRKYVMRQRMIVLAFTLGFLAYAGLYFGGYINRDMFSPLRFIWFWVLYVLVAVMFYLDIDSRYKIKTKSFLSRDFLGFLGLKDAKHVIPVNFMKKSKIFTVFDKIEADDEFTGKYKNMQILVSEQKVSKIMTMTNFAKNSVLSFLNRIGFSCPIFKGVLILLHTDTRFDAQTTVLDKKTMLKNTILRSGLLSYIGVRYFFGAVFFGVCGILAVTVFNSWSTALLFGLFCAVLFYYFSKEAELFSKNQNSDSGRDSKHRVSIGFGAFSKGWDIYSDGQMEARALLDLDFEKQILALKEAFFGDGIDFSFFDNNLLIAVHSRKDLFETTRLSTSALDYESVQDVVNQLYSIYTLIDVLKEEKSEAQDFDEFWD